MILRRLGNKKKIAKEIQKYFPPHKIYIEPFFGAGGMFFNKPKAKYNIVNDIDSEVYNLFNIITKNKEELKDAFYKMPIHYDLLEYWKKNEEIEPIQKCLRFLLMSNCTLLGTGSQLRYTTQDDKDNIYKSFDKVFDVIYDVTFSNLDFRKFISSISYRHGQKDIDRAFFYCDPPYLSTNDNYSDSFIEKDSIDLLDSLEETGCKFAMSEFDHPFILEQAKQRNLNLIIIGERQNLKNRRTEILVTNYSNSQQSLF